MTDYYFSRRSSGLFIFAAPVSNMKPPRNIFSYIVRRPVTTSMLLCGLTLLGLISYFELPVQLFPDITLPQMEIEVWRVGYSADEMEDKVVLPIEAILSATPRVRQIRLYAKRNFSRIKIKYEFGTDMRFAELDMQEKLNQFAKNFEGGGIFGFNVQMASTSEMDSEFMWIVVGGEVDETTLNRVAEDRVAPLIEGIDGVAGVEVGGGRWRTVDVVVHPDMLDAYDLSIEQVISRIKSAVTTDSYLGAVEGPEETHYITMTQKYESLDDIRKTVVGNNGVIRLGDVATISNYEREPNWIFHLNGQNVVSVTVSKEPHANPLVLSKKVKAAIEKAQSQLPSGYTIDIEENVADYIENILDEMTSAAIIGALLAMGVLFLFLRSFRMSLIVFVAIPISIIATFNMMYSFGMSINVFTLLGLAIGVGLLVDNSIVVLENVFRHYEHSHDATDAAERGTGEV